MKLVTLIHNKIKQILKSKFIRWVLIIQTGDFATQMIGFLASVYVARVLGRNCFGTYNLILNVYTFVNLFAAIGIEHVTLIKLAEGYTAHDREKVVSILSYYIKMTFIVLTIIFTLSLVFLPLITEKFYSGPTHKEYIFYGRYLGYVVVILLVLNPFKRIITFTESAYFCTERIKQGTVVKNIVEVLRPICVIILVFFGFSIEGAIFGHILAFFILGFLSLDLYRQLRKKENILPSFRELMKNVPKAPIWSYFRLGFLITLAKEISQLVTTLPGIYLGFFYDPGTISDYKIASRLIEIPSIFGDAVAKSFLLKVSGDMGRNQVHGIYRNFIKLSLTSFGLNLILTLGFIIVVPYFITYTYGREYLGAVPIIYILSINCIVSGIAIGVSTIFRVFDKMKTSIKLALTVFFIISVPGYFLIKNYSVYGAAWAIVLSRIFIYIIGFFVCLKIIREKIEEDGSLKEISEKSKE